MGVAKTFFLVLLFAFCFKYTYAQSCCAEVLGGSRISFGYGVSSFNAAGFNNYIKTYNQNRPQLIKKMEEFGMGMGFHGGLEYNYIMDYRDETYMSMGFWYEHVKESNEAIGQVDNIQGKREYALSLTTLSMNMSVNMSVSKWIDITILGGSLGLYWANLENKYTEPGISKSEKLSSESTFGGDLYTGARLYLFTYYVSVQAFVGYSFMSLPTLNFENGNSLSRTESDGSPMDNFIENGGFYGRVHLSIGIPNLY